MDKIMLTTIDNPFDPFTQWVDWLAYDRTKEYYTCELIARVADIRTTDDDSKQETKLSNAIDLILKFSPFHLAVHPKDVDGGEGSS